MKSHEPLTIGKHPEETIIGIGHVGGLRDVLQPESNSTPALLSFTNYLEAWPNSIVLINAERARVYETSMDKSYNSTAALLEDIPNLPIIAEFIQKFNMYIAPNYNFLYTRKTPVNNLVSCSKKGDLNQHIHTGMMDVLDQLPATLDQTLSTIATNKFPHPAVLQISSTNQSYVSLSDKTDLEVNLVESETKDIFVAPAIDEEAQKEAAHDSGASSCLIGFHEVYHNYKEQVIPI